MSRELQAFSQQSIDFSLVEFRMLVPYSLAYDFAGQFVEVQRNG
jgi:hypothetical protein